MTSDSLISVIVTCYNQENSIATTIASVTGQTFANVQCIVVDDGSTDGSAKVVRELAAKDDRIQLIGKENSGVAAARNFGFCEAQGEFIQFLDGDDTLEPEKLQLQIEHFAADDSIDVSFTNHRFFDASKQTYSTLRFETSMNIRWSRCCSNGWTASAYPCTLHCTADEFGELTNCLFQLTTASDVKTGYSW